MLRIARTGLLVALAFATFVFLNNTNRAFAWGAVSVQALQMGNKLPRCRSTLCEASAGDQDP